jgi:hypothetical protein
MRYPSVVKNLSACNFRTPRMARNLDMARYTRRIVEIPIAELSLKIRLFAFDNPEMQDH